MRHVFTSAGDPALFTARLHDAGMTVVHVVGSLKGALKAADAGVDALVVEGVEGGGFKSALGASTMVLLPLVAERVGLPIICAGGMCDARSCAAAVVLGAEGVQMGTRMLASEEAAVHANFKDAIVAADDAGTVLLDVPGNPTMRVLRTGLASRIDEHHRGRAIARAGSPTCTSVATWRPAWPTPGRCPRGSPTCSPSPTSSDAPGARSKAVLGRRARSARLSARADGALSPAWMATTTTPGPDNTLSPSESLDSDEVRNDDGDIVVDPPDSGSTPRSTRRSTRNSPPRSPT